MKTVLLVVSLITALFADAKLHVVASVPDLADMARQIGGDAVEDLVGEGVRGRPVRQHREAALHRAEILRLLMDGFLRPSINNHSSAFTCQGLRDRKANAFSGTADKCQFVFKLQIHCRSSLRRSPRNLLQAAGSVKLPTSITDNQSRPGVQAPVKSSTSA